MCSTCSPTSPSEPPGIEISVFVLGVVAVLMAIAGLAVVTALVISRFAVHAEVKRHSEPPEPGGAGEN